MTRHEGRNIQGRVFPWGWRPGLGLSSLLSPFAPIEPVEFVEHVELIEPVEPVEPIESVNPTSRQRNNDVVAAKKSAISKMAFQRDVDLTPTDEGKRSTHPDIGATVPRMHDLVWDEFQT